MGNTTIYTINIGDFTVGETTYTDRCLSASFGGSGVSSESIPWEGTENNPWDYRAEYEAEEATVTDEEGNETTETVKHYTGEFVLDAIAIPEEAPQATQLDRIEAQAMYTALMTDTLIEEE